jgi:hypothetical protein
MRLLALFVLDVVIAIALAVTGSTMALGAPAWLAPLYMVPCFLWVWWRAPMEDVSFNVILIFVGSWTAYAFVRGNWLPAGRAWDFVLATAFCAFCICLSQLWSPSPKHP